MGLDVAGEELCGGGDFLDVPGEMAIAQCIDGDRCGLANLDSAKVGLGDVDPDPKLI
jgi:hypothetical protein